MWGGKSISFFGEIQKQVTTMTTTDYIFINLYKTSIYKHDFL